MNLISTSFVILIIEFSQIKNDAQFVVGIIKHSLNCSEKLVEKEL